MGYVGEKPTWFDLEIHALDERSYGSELSKRAWPTEDGAAADHDWQEKRFTQNNTVTI